MYKSLLIFSLLLSSCSTTRYYVVRHAEKEAPGANMVSDVPLSAAGTERAVALRETLSPKKIENIYASNTIRAKSTAQPLAEALGTTVKTYDVRDTTFTSMLLAQKGSVLVVGHSNTVDNIVNGLMGKPVLSDLNESEYGDLFIVTKKGKKKSFSRARFGR